MTTIPQIRAELLTIAELVGGDIGKRIAELAEETRRRRPVRPQAVRKKPEPKITREQVVGYFMANPKADFQAAAKFFGVNIRAISYAYRGKRK